jgi:hypothetical protein
MSWLQGKYAARADDIAVHAGPNARQGRTARLARLGGMARGVEGPLEDDVVGALQQGAPEGHHAVALHALRLATHLVQPGGKGASVHQYFSAHAATAAVEPAVQHPLKGTAALCSCFQVSSVGGGEGGDKRWSLPRTRMQQESSKQQHKGPILQPTLASQAVHRVWVTGWRDRETGP